MVRKCHKWDRYGVLPYCMRCGYNPYVKDQVFSCRRDTCVPSLEFKQWWEGKIIFKLSSEQRRRR